MSKFWLVAKQEYRHRTFQKSFILGTLTIPFLLVVGITITILIVLQSLDRRPVGFVDESGALARASMPEDNDYFVEFIAFAEKASAETALMAEEIQAYYLLPTDYLETLNVDLYYLEEAPDSLILEDFDDFVRANILSGAPTATQKRIMEGTTLTVRSLNGSHQFQDNGGGVITVMLPFMIALFFLFAILSSSGFFLQVITDEKENRTMEIVITSVSPTQLISGKSVALVAVGLTQLSIWIASVAIAWITAKMVFEGLQQIQLPWDVLSILAIFFLPSYAIMAGLMICIGSVVTELQEGQQISGVINMLFTFPIFFAALVFAAPNSPLLIVLSFWPTTALMTLILRWGFTIIPWWQIALSWMICTSTAAVIIWIAGRLFRLGMLGYGQRIPFKTAINSLRPERNNI